MATNAAYFTTNRQQIYSVEDRVQQRASLNEDASNQNNDVMEDVENTQDVTQTQRSNEG